MQHILLMTLFQTQLKKQEIKVAVFKHIVRKNMEVIGS